MSATDIEKATVATSQTINEFFHEAMRSYEKALKAGIQLQEESVNLWKDLLTKLGSHDELQAKLESMTKEASPKPRERMEEFVERPSECSGPDLRQMQECFSRTIQWMSIPLAGVRDELSAHAGLLNKLGFAK